MSRALVERVTRLPHDTLLGFLVRAPLKLIPRSRAMRVRTGVNEGARWIAGAGTHGYWLGTYEAEQQALISTLVKPGMTVWDVGANAGFYTLAFSRLVGPAGHVYAFEPLAENVDNLRRHLELNDARNVVTVQAAVGAATGTAGFEVAASNSMGHLSAQATHRVPCLTGDGFLERHPDAAPNLIKIDIEGGEGDMLEGATRLLAQCNPTLVLSLHGVEQQRRCAHLLGASGYTLFHLDGVPVQGDGDLHEVYACRAVNSGGVER